jgi:hypothetical protein
MPRINVACPQCGHARSLRKADICKNPRRVCRRCANRRKAPLGYAALTRKYGSLFAERTLAAYRRNHPSRLEQEVASLLAYVPDLKACHREYEIQYAANRAVYVDFLVITNDGRRVALEVDGDYWHPCGPDPGRDVIIRQHAHLVIHLTQNEIDSQHALDLLRLSIQP